MKCLLTGFFSLLIGISCVVHAQDEGKHLCSQRSVDNFGQVFYDEILINKPVKEVWPEILNYAKWQVGHTDAEHITVKGKPRQVGEIVKIIKTHKGAQPYYAETVRLRENRNVVWRIFSDKPNPCAGPMGTSAYLDFRTENVNGKTLFSTSYYAFMPVFGEDLATLREEQMQGKENADFIREGAVAFKTYMENL